MKGKSEKAFKHNIRTEYKEGKPLKQSLAIAYAMKRKGKKMADGGDVKPEPSPEPSPNPPAAGNQEDTDKLRDALKDSFRFAKGGMAEGGCPQCGYAHGGQITDNYDSPSTAMHQTKDPAIDEYASGFLSHEGNNVKSNGPASSETGKKLNQHPVDMKASSSMPEQDLVDRVMEKRQASLSSLDRYSEGGKIANNAHEFEPDFEDPNEFDDLVLRDDLSSSYGEDNNAGDSNDNEGENERRSDIVARIMASRRKKDKLPRPA